MDICIWLTDWKSCLITANRSSFTSVVDEILSWIISIKCEFQFPRNQQQIISKDICLAGKLTGPLVPKQQLVKVRI